MTTVSRSAYVWSHVGIIVFHILIAVLLLFSQYRGSVGGVSPRKLVIGSAVVLLIVSLLGLIPILQKKETITISA